MTQRQLKADSLFLLPPFELTFTVGPLPRQYIGVRARVAVGNYPISYRQVTLARGLCGEVPILVENAMYTWVHALAEAERERHLRRQGMQPPHPTHFPDWPASDEQAQMAMDFDDR